MEYKLITLGTQPTNQQWKDLIRSNLLPAKSFEIHCWTEEAEWIELALRYGALKETDWAYGKVISGEATPDFAEMVLNLPKPADTEIYNKEMFDSLSDSAHSPHDFRLFLMRSVFDIPLHQPSPYCLLEICSPAYDRYQSNKYDINQLMPQILPLSACICQLAQPLNEMFHCQLAPLS